MNIILKWICKVFPVNSRSIPKIWKSLWEKMKMIYNPSTYHQSLFASSIFFWALTYSSAHTIRVESCRPPPATLLWNNRLKTFSHDIENSLENISQLCGIYCAAIIYLIFNFLGGHFRLISSIAKVNNAVVNVFVLKSLFIFCISSWGWIPRNGITE